MNDKIATAHVEWDSLYNRGRMWYNDNPSDVFQVLKGTQALGEAVIEALNLGYTIVEGMPEEE